MKGGDSGGGAFGVIKAILAVIGALTVMGILAVAGSVLAWELELRKSEQETSLEPPVMEPPISPTV